jgi:cytosine/uracil/thiamine/allantoin permease
MAVGMVSSVPSALGGLYTYAWFVGFAVSAGTYTLLMRLRAPVAAVAT